MPGVTFYAARITFYVLCLIRHSRKINLHMARKLYALLALLVVVLGLFQANQGVALAQNPIRWTEPAFIPYIDANTEAPFLLADPNGTIHAFSAQKVGSYEYVIVYKGEENHELYLNHNNTDHVVVKSMTNLTILPDVGLIDEEYDEVVVDKFACIEFRFCTEFIYKIRFIFRYKSFNIWH